MVSIYHIVTDFNSGAGSPRKRFRSSFVKKSTGLSVKSYMGRRTRLFLSIYFGFAVYCLVVLVFGRTGMVASSELQAYKARLETNLTHLENINTQLASHFDSLRTNPVTIRLEARQLGFLEPTERVIQVSGYTPPTNAFAVGSLLSEKRHTVTTDAVTRLVGLGAAIVAFILLGLFSRRRDGPQKR